MSNQESKIRACNGSVALPFGGGTRATIASRTSSTPSPLFALIGSASSAGIASTLSICSFTLSGSDAGKFILLITGLYVWLIHVDRTVFYSVFISSAYIDTLV